MLREYQLTNFKAFAGPETIPVRPITLIYGPNSSGKSSILQSLLLLKQTLQEIENPEALLLPKGNLVNLGSYRDFIHRHDVSQSFSFKALLEVDERVTHNQFTDPIADKLIDTALLGLRAAFSYDPKNSNVVFSSLDLFLGKDSSSIATYKPQKTNNIKQKNSAAHYDISILKKELNPTFAPVNLEIFGGNTNDSTPTILKLESINYEHKFWMAWWEKIGQQLPMARALKVKEILKNLKYNKNRQGWENSLFQELGTIRQELNEQLNQLEDRNDLRQVYKAQIHQIESLIQLWQHFEEYSFEKAKKDLKKINESSLIYYQSFLPIKSLSVSLKRTPESQLSDWSELYKLRWKTDLSQLTVLASFWFRRFLENLVYIGPLREYPERLYILSGNLSKQVGKSGKMLPDILFKNPSLMKKVNEQLDRFGLGYELKVASLNDETSESSDIFALRLVDKNTGVNVSLLDVGFGISQVLPIVVQSMLSQNQAILIEQPEIHIHPRLQAELGSLLAECIKSPFNNQFIIETHSEHLLLRLQKLIRKKELKPEDVAVIYVDRASEGSKCLHLRLDEEGDFIDEWPNGFFDEDFNEIFG